MRRDDPGVADARAFLDRLTALAPDAPVRVRPEPAGTGTGGPVPVALWAPLPWQVLVTRRVAVDLAEQTLPAAALAAALAAGTGPVVATGPAASWRWSLPGTAGREVERIPAAELWRLGEAAARTLREVTAGGVGGRRVGQRAVRDALLDHVPVVVQHEAGRTEVSQRLVQALLRMAFVPRDEPAVPVAVLVAPGWVGLAGRYGTAWRYVGPKLTLMPAR